MNMAINRVRLQSNIDPVKKFGKSKKFSLSVLMAREFHF